MSLSELLKQIYKYGAAEVKTAETVAALVMKIVKNEMEEPCKLSLDQKIQRVEDLTLLIYRWAH